MKQLALWWVRWVGVFLILATACSDVTAKVTAVEPKADGNDNTEMPEIAGPENPVEPEAPVQLGQKVHRQEVVEIGKDVLIGANEETRDVVVVGGNAKIDGLVRGNVVVVSGHVDLNGRVSGSVVSVLGGVTMGPKARVHENVVSIGGAIDASPQSKVGNQQINVPLGIPFDHWFGRNHHWLGNAFHFGPSPRESGWAWMLVPIFSLLLYSLLTVVFPGPLRQCTAALEKQPFGSMMAGILGFLLIGPVIVLLIITIIGILAVPFLVLGLLAAFIFGKVAFYRFAGEQLGRLLSVKALEHPLWALAAGMGVFWLVYLIPVFGFLVAALASLLGFGAVLMALFGGTSREKTPVSSILPPITKPPGTSPSSSPSMPPPVPPVMPPPWVPPGTPAPKPSGSAASSILSSPLGSSTQPAMASTASPLASDIPPLMTMPIPPLGSASSGPKLGDSTAGPTSPNPSGGVPPSQPNSGVPPLGAPPFGIPPLHRSPGSSTPPAVDLTAFPPASLQRRIWAAAIDVVFVLAAMYFLLPHFLLPGPRSTVIWLVLYFVGMWTWRGTSLGGIIMQLQVVRLDGNPLKPEVAIIRALAGVLSCLPLFLGFLWAVWDRDRQTWHDKIAGTMVVSVPASRPLL